LNIASQNTIGGLSNFDASQHGNVVFQKNRTQELANLIMPERKSTMEDKWLGLIIDFRVSICNNITLFVIL